MDIVILNPYTGLSITFSSGSLQSSQTASEFSLNTVSSEIIVKNSNRDSVPGNTSQTDLFQHEYADKTVTPKMTQLYHRSLRPKRRQWQDKNKITPTNKSISTKSNGSRHDNEFNESYEDEKYDNTSSDLKLRRHDGPLSDVRTNQTVEDNDIRDQLNYLKPSTAIEKSKNYFDEHSLENELSKEYNVCEDVIADNTLVDCDEFSDIGTLYLNKKLERNVDVRYITNFLHCLDKFKPNYDCTPAGCPNLIARLHEHRFVHHNNSTPAAPIPPTHQIVTSDKNKIQPSTDTIGFPASQDNKFTQMKTSFPDLGKITISIKSMPNTDNLGYQIVHETYDSSNPITLDNNDNKNLDNNKPLDPGYQSTLEKEIDNWTHKLPLYANEDDATIKEREHALNKLIDDIKDLVPRANDMEYDTLIKNATESALRSMKLKYPLDYEKEFAIKKSLHNNILARIHETNKKILGITPTNDGRISNIRKESLAKKRNSNAVGRKLSLNTGRREKGSRPNIIINRGDSTTTIRRESSIPISGFSASREKTEACITLGKNRKKTESIKTMENLNKSASTASFNPDDGDDFGTLLPKDEVKNVVKYIKDDVSSGYAGNADDSSVTSGISKANQMQHMETTYLNTGQYGPINDGGMLHKQNEEFEVDKTRSLMGKKIGHISHEVRSPGTKKRTNESTGWNQQTTDKYCQETRQRNRNLYLEKDSVRCTLSSEKPCVYAKCLQRRRKFKKICRDFKREIEFEILNWISSTNIIKEGDHTRRQDIANAVVDYLAGYLDKPNDVINNTSIKDKIYTIFKDLGIESLTGRLHIVMDKIIDKLVNKLINIKKIIECNNNTLEKSIPNVDYVTVKHNRVYKDELKHNLMIKIMKCLKETNANSGVLNNIAQLLINKIDSTETRDYKNTMYDISMILKVTGKSEDDRKQLAGIIIENTKHVLAMACHNADNNSLDTSSSLVTCSSENDSCGLCPCTPLEEGGPPYSVSQTSKKNRNKRGIEALNANEKVYMDKIAKVLQKWLGNVNFNQEENKELKDVILYDLAGEIVAHEKLNQLAPDPSINQEQFIRYHIYKWLMKFEIFNDVHQSESAINELSEQLQTIDVPDLIKPRPSSIKSKASTKHVKGDASVEKFGSKVTEQVIEQGSKVFCNTTPIGENKKDLIHELTQIQPLLSEQDKNNIKKATENSANIFKEPKHKVDTVTMSRDLANKVTKLPQDARITKVKKNQERIENSISDKIKDVVQKNIEQSKEMEIRLFTQKKNTKRKSVEAKESTRDVHVDLNSDIETTLKEYILKYIHKNYEVDDAMTRGVYAQLLKIELQKLNATTDKKTEKEEIETFSAVKLHKELQYVKDISDWLKNSPIEVSFNVINNKSRIDFICNLAKNIVKLEDERVKKPDAIDYNINLGTVITKFTEQLPLLPDTNNVTYMVDQLLNKIIARRNQEPTYPQANEPKLTEFIDQYVRVHGKEIAGDELKLEAWSARILKEMQKIVNEPDATVLPKLKIYRKLSFISASGSESVNRFQQELDIAKEIVDWLKNLLLLESKSDIIVLLVSDLAQKICAVETNKSDPQVKKEFDDYLDYWFEQLPLQEKQEVDKAMAVDQLMNRVKRVTESKDQKGKKQHKLLSFSQSTRFTENEEKAQKVKSQQLLKDKSDPGQKLVKAIDNWCRNLSFDGGNPETKKIAKDYVATKLYQKIHALNNEPRINADNSLFTREMGFEIDNTLQNLPEKLKLKGDQNALRQRLLLKVNNAREELVNNLAGDNYNAALDTMLNNSLPNPMRAENDPDFDMYKNKLTDIFILENFDYSINDPNRKYVNHIKSKINQLSQSAQKRNAVPLSKEDIYNALYCSMYKVPKPHENIMADRVEEIKTKCEIVSWFDKLPISPPQDSKELKRWDRILTTLAKRIHYIEKVKTNADEKIHKEITKLLIEFPIQGNVDDFANKLVTKLKASEKYRKCIKSGDYVENPVKVEMYPTVPLTDDQLMLIQKNDSKKRGVDIITDVVEAWCSKLPITASNIEDQNSIRDGIVTDILKKLSELNSDPEVFDGEIVYNYLLDKELDRILNKLPQDSALQNKELRKKELIEAVGQARKILKEERIRHYYIEDLQLIVISILPMPQNANLEYDALYDYTIDKVISNFIEYAYNRDDEEAKQFYKSKIFNDVSKYMTVVKNQADPLIVTNIIICDMAKLPIPKDYIIREQIDEIRMRDNVKEFVNDIFSRNKRDLKQSLKDQQVNCLTKILCMIEKSGHNEINESEMKKAILKTLYKLKPNCDIDDKKIFSFIEHLRESEPFRKAFPVRKPENAATGDVGDGCQNQYALNDKKIPNDSFLTTGGQNKDLNNLTPINQTVEYPSLGVVWTSSINQPKTYVLSSLPIIANNPDRLLLCHPKEETIEPPSFGVEFPATATSHPKTNVPSSLRVTSTHSDRLLLSQPEEKKGETPSYGVGFSAKSTPQPKTYGPSSLPVISENSDRLLLCQPKEDNVEPWHSLESGAEIRLQEVSAMIHDPLLIANPAEGSVQPWTSTSSGAQLQMENISAKIHNIPRPDITFRPFKPPPELDFTNTSTQPGVHIPWTSTSSGAQLQMENISAKIHNIPGPDITFRPFKPPPELDFTNTSTQPGVYVPWTSTSSGAQLQMENKCAKIHNVPGLDISFQPFKPPPELDFTNTSTQPGVYVPWTSTSSGAQLQMENKCAKIHNVPGLDIYFQPFKPPPELDFTNTSTQPGVYIPWTSTSSGAQLQMENISAKTHNIPGADIYFQPFKPPPELDFTNTSTQPGVYVPSPVCPCTHGSDNQLFSKILSKVNSTFTSDQVSPTVYSPCQRNQELEHLSYKQKLPLDTKQALLPRRMSRHVIIKEPFEDFGAQEQLHSPEVIINTQNIKSPAVPTPIPTGLAVPGPVPYPTERSPGAGVVPTSIPGCSPACAANAMRTKLVPKPNADKASASEFSPIEEKYEQQSIVSGFTKHKSTECAPCLKYFKKIRSPYRCICPLSFMNITRPRYPCLYVKENFC